MTSCIINNAYAYLSFRFGMSKKILFQDEPGFTIVEVLIVLAVAGLIILIVFLAVPAMQRSVRNHNRKNDASRIGSAALELVQTLTGQTITSGNFKDASVLTSTGTLSYYPFSPTNLGEFDANVWGSIPADGGGTGPLDDTEKLVVTYGATCTNTGGIQQSSHGLAVRYALESGSDTPIPQCLSE